MHSEAYTSLWFSFHVYEELKKHNKYKIMAPSENLDGPSN